MSTITVVAVISMSHDDRRTSPAALRNREPILDVLRTVLPPAGLVLEVASGSGEHVIHFARALSMLTWQPSDPSADARASISAWIAEESLPNLRSPLDLDAQTPVWPVDSADAIIAINMVHITPWGATLGLLGHASRMLPPSAPLILYGPFARASEEMAPSNVAFDVDLRARNPNWGVRSLEDVAGAAHAEGLSLAQVVMMPANNLSVIFRRDP